MTEQLRFLLDANVLITAHRLYYAFDIAPGFWRVLIEQAEKGHIISIDRVRDELIASKDALSNWVRSAFGPWFMSTDDEEVFQSYEEIINWSMEQDQFLDYAKAEFASVADSWLIAYAKAYGCTVVTNETYNKEIRRKIQIPNVCEAFGIEYMNTFEMLRKLKVIIG
jgi:hypothetical protein